MLRADLTPTAPEAGLVPRLAATAAQAPAPATEGRAYALRNGLGAVLAAGVTVVAGVGVSYAAGVVDPPWAPPTEAPPAHAPRHTTSPHEAATTNSHAPGSTPSGRTTRGNAIASERSHGRRGDEKGGPHRPTATPAHGHSNGRGATHRRTDAPGRTGDRPTPGSLPADRGRSGTSHGTAPSQPAPAATRSAHVPAHGNGNGNGRG